MKNSAIILLCSISLVLVYTVTQGVRCRVSTKAATQRLKTYNSKSADLSYGKMSYVDKGDGDVILSVHGIFGGYDQAFETCRDFLPGHRVIAPSRFGYLGSDVLGDGSPAWQATAFAELLDHLGIGKAILLATSAGGSVAIRFAIDYPERTRGLILYCSAMPLLEKPAKYAEYAGPPAFLCNDFLMFLLSPMFRPIMGMEPSTIYGMLPIAERKTGVVLDAAMTNPDMARNFEQYDIESIEAPVLILHSKDDRLASFSDVEKALPRFRNCTFIPFETGGHLMLGHGDEIRETAGNWESTLEKTDIID